MSVWPNTSPTPSPALGGSEGELVAISVAVEPRELEDLLEALAMLDFPVNPEIYHDAGLVCLDPDGSERIERRTIVEFPAYAGQLKTIRAALDACGFSGESISVASMLEEIHGDKQPGGANHPYRILRMQAPARRAGSA